MKKAAANGSYYGVVTDTGCATYTDGNGKITASLRANVVCTDGAVRSFNTDNDDLEAGDLVSATYSNGNTVVKEIWAKSITGTVSSDGAKLGNVDFAANVEILDTTDDGGYARIYTTRLANKTISGGDVRYYTLDSTGNITSLILNNVTGDMDSYGILTKITETSKTTLTPVEGSNQTIEEVDYTGTYEVILDGSKTTLTSDEEQLNLSKGAVLVRKNSDGTVKTIRNMKSYAITSVNGNKAVTSSGSYEIAENAACYIKLNTDTYVLADVYSISDTGAYRLKGYYENGRIRLIAAEPR